jgi:hypothetical protein
MEKFQRGKYIGTVDWNKYACPHCGTMYKLIEGENYTYESQCDCFSDDLKVSIG